MEYEIYRHTDASDEAFTSINKLYRQVLNEDKELCNNAQKNLNAGIFTNGKLHPFNEKVCPEIEKYCRPAYQINLPQGPLYFQKLVKSSVMGHKAMETELGDEIWPARPKVEGSDGLEEEIKFCAQLSCEEVPKDLAW